MKSRKSSARDGIILLFAIVMIAQFFLVLATENVTNTTEENQTNITLPGNVTEPINETTSTTTLVTATTTIPMMNVTTSTTSTTLPETTTTTTIPETTTITVDSPTTKEKIIGIQAVPTHTAPILNSTDGSNYTNQNLTCYNQSTSDTDGDPVKNIFNWKLNGTSIIQLNMPFEGGSNSTWTREYSGYGNNGTVSGATWNSTGGYDGKAAYAFDGINDVINIGNNSALRGTNVTINAWVYYNGGSGTYDPIVTQSDVNWIGYYFYIDTSTSDRLGFWLDNTEAKSTISVPANEWHMVTGMHNDTHLAVYMDGVLLNTAGRTGSGKSKNGFIGYDDVSDYFNGTIDDVLIYNIALSAEQIIALYNNRTDLIVSQELSVGQNWTCEVTPNDGTSDGTTLESNNLTILADAIPPYIILNAPANNTNTTNNWVLFNFTATDNFASTLNCTLYINDSANATNSSTANNTATTFNITNIAHGTYQWYVNCTDSTSNTNTSATRQFFVNQTPLLGSVSASPSSLKGGNIIYISPSGVDDPQSSALYYFCSEASTTPNSSNNICSGNNGTTYSSPYSTMNCSFITATGDATYTVYCRVYDGTYYSSVKNTTYTTDSIPPALSTISVAGDTVSPYYDNVNDGWTNITVSGEAGMSCRWEDQDHGYSTMPGDAAHTCSISGTQATCSPQNLDQSLTTNLYVSCKDSLDNENNATNNLDISVVIDWTAPTTTDNSSTTIVVPSYVVNITESDNLYGTPSITTKYCTDTVGTCTPDTSIDHGENVTFTSSNRGQNFFRYNSSDPAGNIQTVQNKTININQLPVLTSATDSVTTVKGGGTVTISTVSSDADSGQTLKLYVCNSTSANSSGCTDTEYCSNTSASANASCSFTSATDDTTYIWYAFIYDSLNEAATANYLSGTYTTDSTSPTITIIDPDNTTYSSTSVPGAISLSESGSWAGYCVDNCASNTTMSNSSATYWVATVSASDGSSHTVVFYANDSYGNMGTNNETFTVDTTANDTIAPSITVWSPTNGTYYSSSSVLANITLSEDGSWAGYSLNGTANVTMGNVSTTSWNDTMTLADGEYNITFFANDTSTNGNMGNSSVVYFYVDTTAPRNTTQGPSTENDTVNFTCYSQWTDNIALDYGYLEHNATGTAENSSQILLSGTSGWVNSTINSSATDPGMIQCKAYAFDKAGLVNTSTWLVNITDVTNPVVENITYTPNTTGDLDPNIMINVTANVTDNGQLSSVTLYYKLTNASTWNTSTMNAGSGNLYTGNFTPTQGNWSFRINATDSYRNENVTDMTNISVDLDRTWVNVSTLPSIKAIVRTQSRVFSLGNLTVNNTGDYDLNFTVTSDSSWITFNGTTNTSLEFILNQSGNSTEFNVTANTTGFAVGEYAYTITINSYTLNPTLVSTSNISGTVVIQNVAGPYFDVKIITYDSTVTQGDSGISLSSSLENVGTGDATGTWLAWTLPSGWSVASGTANVSVGFLGVGETVSNSITVGVSSSATTGDQTLMASAGSSQGITGNDTKTVTVSAAEAVTTTTPSTAAAGGGGGLGAAALVESITSGEEVLSSSETFELIRGYSDTFSVDVKNIFKLTTLYNVSIKIEGYLSQHMAIFPSMIDRIEYDETKQFNVTIVSPEYMEKGTHELTIIITGKIIGPGIKKDLTETRSVTLVIHTVSGEEVSNIIELAMADIKEMGDAGFPITKVSKLLEDAKKALEEHEYDNAKNLAETIRTMKENAFKANDLIQEVKSKMKRYVALSGAFTGGVRGFSETEEVLNLAIAAFEREDFDTALKRGEDARLTLALEKGEFNLLFFLADYWWAIVISVVLLSVSGVFGYQRYVTATITQKIRNLEKEEETIRKLMEETQVKHFKEKTIGATTFRKTMDQHKKRFSKIKQLRAKLRHKRLRLLKPEKLIKDLEEERKDLVNLLKNLQGDYFVDRKISKAEYDEQQKAYNERLAEIEGEQLTLETKLSKKGEMRK